MCQMAEASIENVLDENDNAVYLLAMHLPSQKDAVSAELESSHAPGARFIRIK